MYIFDGEIDLSYSKDNHSILVDTLPRGSYLFPYTSLTNEPVRSAHNALGGAERAREGEDQRDRDPAADHP